MSMLDKVIAKLTPQPSDQEIAAARASLRQAGQDVGWVEMVCQHHDRIDEAFTAVIGATSVSGQRAAERDLARLLTGHSLAEEAVLYPGMALSDQKAHAEAAYLQQSAAKVQIAALADLEPQTSAYSEKLQHLRPAVVVHVFEEETSWFPKLLTSADEAAHARMTERYRHESGIYLGASSTGTVPSPAALVNAI